MVPAWVSASTWRRPPQVGDGHRVLVVVFGHVGAPGAPAAQACLHRRGLGEAKRGVVRQPQLAIVERPPGAADDERVGLDVRVAQRARDADRGGAVDVAEQHRPWHLAGRQALQPVRGHHLRPAERMADVLVIAQRDTR
jgi:hypothetical protein